MLSIILGYDWYHFGTSFPSFPPSFHLVPRRAFRHGTTVVLVVGQLANGAPPNCMCLECRRRCEHCGCRSWWRWQSSEVSCPRRKEGRKKKHIKFIFGQLNNRESALCAKVANPSPPLSSGGEGAWGLNCLNPRGGSQGLPPWCLPFGEGHQGCW